MYYIQAKDYKNKKGTDKQKTKSNLQIATQVLRKYMTLTKS